LDPIRIVLFIKKFGLRLGVEPYTSRGCVLDYIQLVESHPVAQRYNDGGYSFIHLPDIPIRLLDEVGDWKLNSRDRQ
jgi:hypothetical protein